MNDLTQYMLDLNGLWRSLDFPGKLEFELPIKPRAEHEMRVTMNPIPVLADTARVREFFAKANRIQEAAAVYGTVQFLLKTPIQEISQ